MPIHGYPGNIITANPTEPSQTSASGVWTTELQLQYQNAGKWPPPYYLISRSLRFNSADSANLSRTPASAGNRRTMTYSFWYKRSTLGTSQQIISAGSAISDQIFVGDTNIIRIYLSGAYRIETTPVYRDPSSWYHIVVAIDTTQATGSNRVRLYVNGSEVTAYSGTTISQNTDIKLNDATTHYIGRYAASASEYLNGYLTEINFIDGQALTPSSFGQTNSQTGIWEPVKYTGTYGTNGFYLNFSDSSNTTAATLGKDSSGNGNNYTPSGFSVTAGAGNDSLVDTPTSYGSDTGVGGEVRGNYATLNPLAIATTSRTYSNGNLDVSISAANINVFGSFAIPTSGKWYWEYQITTIGSGGAPMGGVAAGFITDTSSAVVYRTNGDKIVNGTQSAYGATYTTTDTIGVAADVDGGTVTFYKNGSSQGALTFAAGGLFPALRSNVATDNFTYNFGQRPFAYTAPSGFKALCTQNLPTPTIGATSTTQAGKYFNAVLYTGNGSTQSISGVGFQPDFVWNKSRSAATDHYLFDAVRGAGKGLFSTSTSAEFDYGTGSTSPNISFDSNGFTMGSNGGVNTNAATYVAWNWNAGGSNATNTSGTITSTVRANTTAGFSIVTYSGTSVVGTIGHGLGVAPSMIIVKSRNTAGTDWATYHASIGATAVIALNSTGTPVTIAGSWNNTAPTSSVFTVGTGSGSGDTNFSGRTYVAYCFAQVTGYSAFGSYTGNGSADGPFVFTGMRPRYILIKRTTNADNWFIFDTARNSYNVANLLLYTNLANAEATFTSLDILSNGFKIRTSDAGFNASANDYIYAAFCESPFKYALAR